MLAGRRRIGAVPGKLSALRHRQRRQAETGPAGGCGRELAAQPAHLTGVGPAAVEPVVRSRPDPALKRHRIHPP